jgi:hypothetical protein
MVMDRVTGVGSRPGTLEVTFTVTTVRLRRLVLSTLTLVAS